MLCQLPPYGHVARTEKMRYSHKILLKPPGWKRPPGRTMCRWGGNVGMNLNKYVFKIWIGFIWIMIGSSGWLL